ncbi:unnamed protein product [Rotaria magnacalcarata]|uniref:Uncharacterized protein n=2 Tax=Rotaria magnacalcarata TaxID=392030 RepID=A0A816SQH6_9BILA|nr:unnamed protein product [Rotaria magnacalcarata]CAF2128954.1 unnamed protein product [Rotaria magnacalcarata]
MSMCLYGYWRGSVERCELDLSRFGAEYTANSNRSYFPGHEREDVVKHRKESVKCFIEREQHFYTITNDAVPQWKTPTTTPTILLCHDESTYKCGEIAAKRWIMSDNAPFYNKGRGRSIMCSDLLVMHPSGPFFSLTDKEYSEALKKYPHLNDDCDINYEKNSVSAAINVGGDNYFDNQDILSQFKCLFQLLPFKNEYKNHNFVCLLDNTITNTAADMHINDFRMRPRTRSPVDNIDYIDENNKKQTIECYDNDGYSKCLLGLAYELNVFVPIKCKLNELKLLLSQHTAFKSVSKLEKLAAEYNVKIPFSPKYHCETNPIGGYWCHSK